MESVGVERPRQGKKRRRTSRAELARTRLTQKETVERVESVYLHPPLTPPPVRGNPQGPSKGRDRGADTSSSMEPSYRCVLELDSFQLLARP